MVLLYKISSRSPLVVVNMIDIYASEILLSEAASLGTDDKEKLRSDQ